MNEYFDQRLRPFLTRYQDNWKSLLPVVDLVQLTLPHEALGGLTPHEVERGFPLALPWHWERRTQDWEKMPATERLNREEAQAVGQKVRQYIEAARTALGRTQARMTA